MIRSKQSIRDAYDRVMETGKSTHDEAVRAVSTSLIVDENDARPILDAHRAELDAKQLQDEAAHA